MRIFARILLILFLLALAFLANQWWDNRPVPEFDRKILVFSKTTEYRHDAIPIGIKTLTEIGRGAEFNVVSTEAAEVFTDKQLATFRAVIFLNTTGDVLDIDQQMAMERYIQAGGGFLGVHSAADTEWRTGSWYWYQRLVGGVFASHPKDSEQQATLRLSGDHISVTGLPESFQASDEWYDFQRTSRGVNVLLTVDESTYEGGKMGGHHPVAWYRDFDGGRSFYIALGHSESTYKNEHFLSLLQGGLTYAMGKDAPLDYTKSRPESWRFNRQVLDSHLNEPLKLSFSPQGDLYYIERKGALKQFDFERGKSVLVKQFDVFTEVEYGLIGLAFDPDFANNHWLYIYRTVPQGDAGKHVLSRFKLVDNDLDMSSEQIFLSVPVDGNSQRSATHTGGDMQFDSQGNLWLSTGDDTAAGDQGNIDDRPGEIHRDAARSSANTQDLRGKILRIRPRDHSGYDIPSGNLFIDPAQGRPEIFVMGVRNPYTIAFDDRTGFLYWGEVGPDGKADGARGPMGYDEVNRTQAPGNFGWPYVIANRLPYAYFDYDTESVGDFVDPAAPRNRSRNNTGAKILPPAQSAWMYYPYGRSETWWELGTGGRNALVVPFFYSEDFTDNPIKFPPYMDGKLIISDFIRRWIKVVSIDSKGRVETITPLIDAPLSAPLDMAYGPDGALYIVEYGTNWFQANADAYLSRIEFYSEENPPPVAIGSASKTVGAAPLQTVLDASASFDRGQGDAQLSYRWQLMDGLVPLRELGTEQQQSVTIPEPGDYAVRLTVTDEGGASGDTPLRLVVGNEPPRVQVAVDGNRSFYFGDDSHLKYHVTVDDLEDGSTAAGTIDSSLVKVVFEYIGQSEDLARALAVHTTDPVLAGRELATDGSDCHACHAVETESVGPAFNEIGQRYRPRADAASYLAKVIAEGGSGQWTEGHSMPGHPDLSVTELGYLSAFILSLGGEPVDAGTALPLQGEVHFDQHDKDYVDAVFDQVVKLDLGRFFPGSYVLHASYSDRGAANSPSLQSSDTMILRHARLSGSAFDESVGMQKIPADNGVFLAAYGKPDDVNPFIYGRLSKIDLSGIKSIHFLAGAGKPILGGGWLELRLDNPHSESVARIKLEATFSTDPEDFEKVIDVSAIDGVHDLYIGSSEVDEGGQAAFVIVSMEFVPE